MPEIYSFGPDPCGDEGFTAAVLDLATELIADRNSRGTEATDTEILLCAQKVKAVRDGRGFSTYYPESPEGKKFTQRMASIMGVVLEIEAPQNEDKLDGEINGEY